jgi:hypothetical protein
MRFEPALARGRASRLKGRVERSPQGGPGGPKPAFQVRQVTLASSPGFEPTAQSMIW